MSPKAAGSASRPFCGCRIRRWVLVLPGRPPLGRHVVAEQGLGPLQVNVVCLEELVTAPLDGPLLGKRSALGREDPGGAAPLALLVADLIPLVRVARGRRDNHDPGHVPCLLVRDGLMGRDPHTAWVPHGFRTSRPQRTSPTVTGGSPTGSLPGQTHRLAPLAQSAEHIHGKEKPWGYSPRPMTSRNSRSRRSMPIVASGSNSSE
jgi:hypothetical protein